ncbi:Wzx [Xenorhabdus bovienii str. kraussei Quebec]|uniref:Wzx n=1 Tax=Xenorhabdus bovienii str. kraussei Quebec TaxID=1398203 RepID=A0A077PJV2_XENBV|nr:O-antigen translocase [Xenorhabdus bovienii]CDH20996.1 Wzx [Xenorhabdus bovienii str. kraussei Quebec]
MNLFKTSLLSLIATSVKLISSFVINKTVAVLIGPSGLAIIGQIQNLVQIIMTIAQGAINTGITKYIAEYGHEDNRTYLLISTSAKITVVCSIISGILIITFSSYISTIFLKNINYQYIFITFGLTIILFSLNQLLLSILNGLKEIKLYISINIIQSIYGLIFTTILIVYFGIDGALFSLVTNQSITFIILIWMLKKHPIIKWANFTKHFNINESKKLLHFAAMTLTSVIAIPTSQIVIRNYITDTIGLKEAGYWQAVWYISSTYLLVVTTTLSTYYLPRLSEIKNKLELRHEIIKGYKAIIPIVVFISAGVFLCKDFIIWILFTEDFKPMRELFKWQLIGDVLKLSSWLIAYIMLSKAMTKLFIITEIIFSLLFIILSMFFISNYGLVGVTYSYAANYAIYLFTIIFFTKNHWL